MSLFSVGMGGVKETWLIILLQIVGIMRVNINALDLEAQVP